MKRVSTSHFWARFQDVIHAAPDLLCIICEHLSRQEKEALRGVNKAANKAINATVTKVNWRGDWRGHDGLAPHKQLQDVFPNVTSLSGGHAVDPTIALGYVQLLASSNVLLLDNLQHLGLELPSSMIVETTTAVIWRILNRCTQLVSLTILTSDTGDHKSALSLQFTGQGPDPRTQALSLRRQVTAFQATPATFLAPASWPAHSCLTTFEHRHNHPDANSPYAIHERHAMQTTSIKSLALLHLAPASGTSTLAPHIPRLSNVTSLELNTSDPSDPVLSAIGDLPRLQHLHLHGKSTTATVLAGEPPAGSEFDPYAPWAPEPAPGSAGAITIPPSWFNLAHLTSFQITDALGSVQLAQLTPLATVQELSICATCVGSLAELQQLGRLTRLALSKPLVDPEYADKSQLWTPTLEHPFSDTFTSFELTPQGQALVNAIRSREVAAEDKRAAAKAVAEEKKAAAAAAAEEKRAAAAEKRAAADAATEEMSRLAAISSSCVEAAAEGRRLQAAASILRVLEQQLAARAGGSSPAAAGVARSFAVAGQVGGAAASVGNSSMAAAVADVQAPAVEQRGGVCQAAAVPDAEVTAAPAAAQLMESPQAAAVDGASSLVAKISPWAPSAQYAPDFVRPWRTIFVPPKEEGAASNAARSSHQPSAGAGSIAQADAAAAVAAAAAADAAAVAAAANAAAATAAADAVEAADAAATADAAAVAVAAAATVARKRAAKEARQITNPAYAAWKVSCRAAANDTIKAAIKVWRMACDAASGGGAAAAEGGSTLQQLWMMGPWPPAAIELPQLAALRVLNLTNCVFDPALCWALTYLPHLHKLELSHPTALPNTLAPPPIKEAERRLLPAMQSISLGQEYSSCTACLPLHLLATTTRLPPGCTLALHLITEDEWAPRAPPVPQVVEVRTWSKTWLEAVVGAATLASGQGLFNFVMHDHADIKALVATLASLPQPGGGALAGAGGVVGVCFGLRVGMEGLQNLATQLKLMGRVGKMLRVGEDRWVDKVVQGWDGELDTSTHKLKEHLRPGAPAIAVSKRRWAKPAV